MAFIAQALLIRRRDIPVQVVEQLAGQVRNVTPVEASAYIISTKAIRQTRSDELLLIAGDFNTGKPVMPRRLELMAFGLQFFFLHSLLDHLVAADGSSFTDDAPVGDLNLYTPSLSRPTSPATGW